VVHGGDYRGRFWLDVSAAGPAGDEHIFGAIAGAAGTVGIDAALSGASACGELDVHARFFLAAGFDRAKLFQGSGAASKALGIAAADAGVGECSRRVCAGLYVAGDLLVWIDMDPVSNEGRAN